MRIEAAYTLISKLRFTYSTVKTYKVVTLKLSESINLDAKQFQESKQLSTEWKSFLTVRVPEQFNKCLRNSSLGMSWPKFTYLLQFPSALEAFDRLEFDHLQNQFVFQDQILTFDLSFQIHSYLPNTEDKSYHFIILLKNLQFVWLGMLALTFHWTSSFVPSLVY